MKRIALFINSLQKGGSERVMVNLAEYFYKNHYEVILVTQYKRENEYEISPKIRRIYSEPEESQLQGGRIHNFFVRFFTLRNIWVSYKPDVILSFLGKNNLMAILTAAFLPSKVVVSVRGEPTMEYPGGLQQLLAKFLFCFADGAVLQTKQVMKFFPKIVQKKATILPNPLNQEFIKKKPETVKENVIVAAGRLDENKNHAMLIHGFSRVAAEFPDMKLVIYGEGESRKDLEALVQEKELSDRISLPGSVTDIPDRISKAKIFVLTSNTEGMPNSVMEAMALGIPTVATDCPCGGPATLIEDGVNGLLVPVGDAYALSDAFRKILSNQEYAEKLGQNAHQTALEWNPDQVNGAWKKYLTGIADKH